MVDTLPAGVSFVSAPGCSVVGSTVTCLAGPLLVGASRSFTLTVQIDSPYTGGPMLVNSATVDSPGDLDPNNDTATATTQMSVAVAPVPTLSTWALILLAMVMGIAGMRARAANPR